MLGLRDGERSRLGDNEGSDDITCIRGEGDGADARCTRYVLGDCKVKAPAPILGALLGAGDPGRIIDPGPICVRGYTDLGERISLLAKSDFTLGEVQYRALLSDSQGCNDLTTGGRKGDNTNSWRGKGVSRHTKHEETIVAAFVNKFGAGEPGLITAPVPICVRTNPKSIVVRTCGKGNFIKFK